MTQKHAVVSLFPYYFESNDINDGIKSILRTYAHIIGFMATCTRRKTGCKGVRKLMSFARTSASGIHCLLHLRVSINYAVKMYKRCSCTQGPLFRKYYETTGP